MKAIEMETLIPISGKLPSFFQEIFGRKVRLIALFEEAREDYAHRKAEPADLMGLAGKITAFRSVEDPIAFQYQLRDEWEDRWDE